MKSISLRPEERPTTMWGARPIALRSGWQLAEKVALASGSPTSPRSVRRERDAHGVGQDGYYFSWGSRYFAPNYTTTLEYSGHGDLIDPLLQLDSRGRRLVEALTAVPIDPDEKVDADALISFVGTFGPIIADGVSGGSWELGWGARKRARDYLAHVGLLIFDLREAAQTIDQLAQGADTSLGRAVVFSGIEHNLPQLRVSQGADGRFGLVLSLRSLREAAYWQLFEHVTRRPSRVLKDAPDPVFRAPFCARCRGVILGTRLAEDKVNKWHAGCKDAGQAAQRRARRKAGGRSSHD